MWFTQIYMTHDYIRVTAWYTTLSVSADDRPTWWRLKLWIIHQSRSLLQKGKQCYDDVRGDEGLLFFKTRAFSQRRQGESNQKQHHSNSHKQLYFSTESLKTVSYATTELQLVHKKAKIIAVCPVRALSSRKGEISLMKTWDSPKVNWRLDQLEHVAGPSMSRMYQHSVRERSVQNRFGESGLMWFRWCVPLFDMDFSGMVFFRRGKDKKLK